MEITSAAGWYPNPDDPATSRWWDGWAWTEKRQPTVAMACPLCGAGHRLPADYLGYQCTACGLIRHFYSCPDPTCATVTALTPDMSKSTHCPGCGGHFWIAHWRQRPITARAAVGEAARFR